MSCVAASVRACPACKTAQFWKTCPHHPTIGWLERVVAGTLGSRTPAYTTVLRDDPLGRLRFSALYLEYLFAGAAADSYTFLHPCVCRPLGRLRRCPSVTSRIGFKRMEPSQLLLQVARSITNKSDETYSLPLASVGKQQVATSFCPEYSACSIFHSLTAEQIYQLYSAMGSALCLPEASAPDLAPVHECLFPLYVMKATPTRNVSFQKELQRSLKHYHGAPCSFIDR